MSRRIGSILAEYVNSAQIQWLVIDDYHEVIEAPEVEQLIESYIANRRDGS